MAEYSKEFLQRTIQVWQPYYRVRLTLQDARQITENMVGLASLLLELDKTEHERDERSVDSALMCPAQKP